MNNKQFLKCQNTLASLAKVVCSLFLVSLATIGSLQAQTDITIGTGTLTNSTGATGYPCPLQDYYEGSRMQFLYLASELQAAGMGPGEITAIRFTVTNLNTFSGDIDQYTVKLGGTGTTSLSESSWETVIGSVNYGPVEYTPVIGVNTLTFTTPFSWNGSDNIIVEICNGDPANSTGTYYSNNPSVTWTTGLAFNASHTYRADNLGNLCGTGTTTNTGTLTTRPNIVFQYTPAPACSGKPTAGTTVSSSPSVCPNSPFILSTSGTTVASGLVMQWQSSADNVSWTNIPGANKGSLGTSQAASTYYRAIVTCSGSSDTSTALLVTSPNLVSGTYTINSGLPTGSGNFTSFSDAVNYIKCGINGPIVFNVEPGTSYNEQVLIPEINGTSATNTITFNGNGATLSFASTISDNRAGFTLNGADHVVIDSININGSAGTYGWGIFLTGGADSNIIKRCTIDVGIASTSSNYQPIVASSSNTSNTTAGNSGNYNTVMNNTLIGGYYGISFYGQSTAAYCKGNMVVGNTIKDCYLYGAYLYYQEDAVFSQNDISRPTRTNSSTGSCSYVGNSIGTLIEKNRVHNLYGGTAGSTSTTYIFYITGADGKAAKPNRVINNLAYDIVSNGTIYGMYNSGSDSTVYYHNTIVLDDPSTTTASAYGMYQSLAATGVEYKNNIVYITRGGTGVKRCIYLNTTTSTVAANNNVYYLAAPAGTDNKVGQYGTNSYTTLTDWKNANSGTFDQASFFVDPVFTNANPDEYKPSDASINNIGENLGVATDIYGVARGANPDPGAVEFTLDGCTNPPLAGQAITTDANPCNGGTFTLNLDGNSIGAGQTYQWQWSTDNVNWTNVGDLQTTPLFSTSQTSAHYYQAQVKCSGGTAVYSASVFVDVVTVGGAYTINNLLPTGGTNFASFTEAANFLKCGIVSPVVFTVEPFTGPYVESVTIGQIKGTSEVNTVTFNGNGTTLSYAGTASADRTTLILDGADHIIIDSLNIDATGGATYGWGMILMNQADSNIIRKCNIITSTTSTSTNFAGVLMTASTSGTSSGNNANYNLFEDNTITGGYYGLVAYGSTSTYNRGNMFVNNKFLEQYNYGLYLYGQKQSVVSKNDISRPTRTNTAAPYCLYLTSCGDSMLVEKNRVHNMFDAIAASSSTCYSIYITGSDGVAGFPSRLENNLVHSQDNNSTLYGMYCAGANWNIYHNTVILDNTAATTTAITYGLYANGANQNVKNNISVINRGGTGSKYSMYLGTSFSGEVNHNDWYMASTSGTANYVAYKSSAYSTLDAWKLSNGGAYDQNSFSVDPLFQQLTPGDFYPSEPVLNNSGEDVGVLTDILEVARTATPDPGAIEFSLPSCTNPPSAGTITATSTICPNTSFTMQVTGNSTGEGIKFQWQVSTDNATWSNIDTPMIVPTITVSQAVSSYYKALVSCNGGTAAETPVVFITSPGLAAAGTYTINSTLPTGSGNFQSFGDAVNFIACGIQGPITFNVTPNSGPYNEQVSIPAVNGTSTVNTVTWNGNGNTLIYDANDGSNRGILTLNGADHMIFDSLTIDASTGAYGFGIILTNSADSNIIRKCSILGNTTSNTTNYGGIIMSGSTSSATVQGDNGDGNLFEKNQITGGYYGIYMYGSTADTMKYNKAIDNVIKDYYNVALFTMYSQFITFSGNDVSRPTRTNTSTEAIWVSTNYGGMLVEKNRFHNNADNVTTGTTSYGFDISGSGTAANPNRLENNIEYNIKAGTSSCYGVYAPGVSYWTIAHNTIVLDDVSATAGTTYGIYVSNTTGLYVYNNIVSISRGGTGTKYCLYYSSTGATASNNNVLYMASSSGTNGIGYYSAGKTTLADWQTTGFDANSVSIDPMFTDLVNGNLAPLEGSIYTLGKTNVGVVTDILGVTRRVNDPTPGAYEMTAGLPVTLMNIDAVRSGADVKVNWATLTEINNKGFDIERSTDGHSFHKVGYVGTRANGGNSNVKLDYQFLDLAAPTDELYYRLKQFDNNGKSENSNVVKVKGIGNRKFDITSLFPNPSHKTDLTLLMSSQASSKITLVVTDVAGKILLQQAETLTQGTNMLKVKVSNLPAGSYFIRAICDDGCETTVKKFVIQ